MANKAEHAATYDVSASLMWQTLSDWSAPFITSANSPAGVEDVKSSGVGATRSVVMLDGSAKWAEKITKYDDASMTWSYVLTEAPPPPFLMKLDTFECSFSVKAVGKGCKASISCVYDMHDGVELFPPEQLAGMYKGWADAAAVYAINKLADGREYLGHHKVQDVLKAAISKVLKERPTNPIKALGEILQPTELVGMPCIHLVWKVPKADEALVDEYWKSHEAWMRASHVMGVDGDDAVAPRLLEFYISKGEELSNPMDPASEKTGNLLYIMSETYAAPSGIASHMAKGTADWPGMSKFGEMGAKYGAFAEVGSTSVFTCLSNVAEPFVTASGQPCIHLVWKVPKADEALVDEYWKSHEAWMRASHVMGVDGDDAVAPRLTSFYISKGEELSNPMDPASEKTGNLLYIMSETYAAPSGIASHMAKGTADWPGMSKFGEMGAKYGAFAEVGSTSVFTHLSM